MLNLSFGNIGLYTTNIYFTFNRYKLPPMEKPSFLERANNWVRNSVTLRLVTMGILILLLLIPVNMVESLIREREYRKEDAVKEVSGKWGNEQIVAGPVLTVP